MITCSGAGVLDELEHPDLEAAAPGAKDHPKRGRRLALALAGVDDYQTVSSATMFVHLGGTCSRIRSLMFQLFRGLDAMASAARCWWVPRPCPLLAPVEGAGERSTSAGAMMLMANEPVTGSR